MGAGGSAVDGAIAANAVLATVVPDTCGPGGDLFALVHVPGDPTPAALNASGAAGSGTSAAALRAGGLDRLPSRHPASITIPGAVDGWMALHERFGRVPFETVLAAAIELAEEGFPVSRELAGSLGRVAELVADQPSAAELYPDGAVPAPGDILRRPAFAATLRAIAEEGRDGFYSGPVADGIVAAAEGAIRPADLERPQAEWIEPLGAEVFGRQLWTMPPNSQGYLTPATLMAFALVEPPRDPMDPASIHLLVEIYRALAAERDDLVADPATAPLPAAELLDPERLAAVTRQIDPNRAGRYRRPREQPGGTAYLCTYDAEGMGVSYIQSNFWGIGSGRSAGATGVWLQNRGAGFNLIPGHPNEYTPGRRPLHTLSPTLWTREGSLHLLLGTRGGHYQPQLLAQFAAAMFPAGLDLDDAQQLPRWVVDDIAAGAPPVLDYEDRFPRRTLEGLAARGHRLRARDPWMVGWGPLSAIRVDGSVSGAADPRVSTAAALAAPRTT